MENIPGVESAVEIKGVIRTGCTELRKTFVHLSTFLQLASMEGVVQFKSANDVSAYIQEKLTAKILIHLCIISLVQLI